MSKAAALLMVGLVVLVALLELVSVSAQSDWLSSAGSGRIAVAPAPPLPPAEGALNPAEPLPGVTLTH